MSVRYLLWESREYSIGWKARAIFQMEGALITGIAPEALPLELSRLSYETASLLANGRPDTNRLSEIPEAEASVRIMELGIEHEKRVLEMGLPAGTYFMLFSRERPILHPADSDLTDGLEECAYGRITKAEGCFGAEDTREFVLLGVHKDRHGPIEELVLLDGAEIRYPGQLRMGGVYTLEASNVISCGKEDMITLRMVEREAWRHEPDIELDATLDFEPRIR
jgi:hypothetical protein